MPAAAECLQNPPHLGSQRHFLLVWNPVCCWLAARSLALQAAWRGAQRPARAVWLAKQAENASGRNGRAGSPSYFDLPPPELFAGLAAQVTCSGLKLQRQQLCTENPSGLQLPPPNTWLAA